MDRWRDVFVPKFGVKFIKIQKFTFKPVEDLNRETQILIQFRLDHSNTHYEYNKNGNHTVTHLIYDGRLRYWRFLVKMTPVKNATIVIGPATTYLIDL